MKSYIRARERKGERGAVGERPKGERRMGRREKEAKLQVLKKF